MKKRKSPDISDALIEKIALGNTDALRELYEKNLHGRIWFCVIHSF